MADEIIGFKVIIDLPDGKSETDATWTSWSGGGERIDGCVSSNSPVSRAGHDEGCEITLRGPVSGKRHALMAWLNETAAGREARRTVTVTEVLRDSISGEEKDGHSLIGIDSLIASYVFPRMSVTNTTGNVIEEVRIKPIRCELK